MNYLSKLIIPANYPVIGTLLRRTLGIDDYRHPIIQLNKNNFHVYLGNNRFRAVIYMNDQYHESAQKYLKRILGTFHAFDVKLANKLKPAWNLGFDTYDEQPASGDDTFIDYDLPTTNYKTSTGLYIGERDDSSQGPYRIWIKFDLSSIHSSAIVISSYHTLYLYDEASNADNDCECYRVAQAATEDMTWNKYDGSNSWSTAGGYSATDLLELTAFSVLTLSGTESIGTKTFTHTVSYIQDWIDGSETNNGWLQKMHTEVGKGFRFRSSDWTTVEQRPRMVVEYDLFPSPDILESTLGLFTPTIGLYDVRYKLRSRQRDTALTTRVRNT
jgi:hypothetical protein